MNLYCSDLFVPLRANKTMVLISGKYNPTFFFFSIECISYKSETKQYKNFSSITFKPIWKRIESIFMIRNFFYICSESVSEIINCKLLDVKLKLYSSIFINFEFFKL